MRGMTKPLMQLTERRLADGVIEIAVEGELDLSVAEQLQQAIDGDGTGTTLVDLAGCTFMDSTGIAVVLRARRSREENGGGRIVLHSPSKQVAKVLRITGLTEDGLLYEDRDAALAALDA